MSCNDPVKAMITVLWTSIHWQNSTVCHNVQKVILYTVKNLWQLFQMFPDDFKEFTLLIVSCFQNIRQKTSDAEDRNETFIVNV